MNCRVYLVRHGETDWNATMRFQGHTDISLSDKGREQAYALATRLAHENFAGIYASDLGRARETAEILARPHNLKVREEPGFREINFGSWEGLTFDEIKEKYPEAAANWWEKPLETRAPGGETLQELVDRCMQSLYQICCRHRGEQILVVSHGGVVRSIIGSILGINLNEYWRLRQDNLALNILHFPTWDKGILYLFNDCCHLKDL